MSYWMGWREPQYAGQTVGLVDNQFGAMMAFAYDAYNSAAGLLTEMASLTADGFIASVAVPEVTIEIADMDYPERPGTISASYSAPSIPTYQQLDAMSVDINTLFPSFTLGAPPDIDLGTEPDPLAGESIPASPSINYPSYPGSPSYSLPNPPTIQSIQIPSPPDVAVGEFNDELILPQVDEPGDLNYHSGVYSSPIWDETIAWVLDGIRNGGTGLGADVEDAIFARAQDRIAIENEKALNEALQFMESRGWTAPPGALAGMALEVGHQSTRNLTQVSDEIAIAQAELAQKNTHFVLSLSKDLEGLLRSFFIENERRLLEAAVAVANNAVEIYKAKIMRLQFDVEAYKVRAEVYKTRIQAALARVELFKAQIEAAKVSAEVQELLVKIYTAQLGAVSVVVDIYKTEMQAAAIQTEAEKLKVDIFKAQIDAYAATINAKTSEWEGYKARMQGEIAKAQFYGEQVKAYAVQVNAAAEMQKGEIAEAEISLEYQKAKMANNANLVEQYKAEIQGAVAELSAAVDVYKAEASMYESEGKVNASMYSAQTQLVQARVAAARMALDGAIAELDAQVKVFAASAGIKMDGMKGAAAVAAQLCAGAMSGIHASASLGYSGADSNSTSTASTQQDVSYRSINFNNNHNWNHD
jgi:hypothetical protein